MAEDRKQIVLGVELDASGVRQGVQQVTQATDEMSRRVGQGTGQAAEGVKKIGDGAEGSAKKIDRAQQSIISSIERTTATLKAGERGSTAYFEALAAQRGVSVDALKPYLDQLRQAEAAQKVATAGLGKMEISAKQTAAALRGVPAQFTDIITSLQGGQAPLTVFLQQGGQLKDMFGGAGNAARALGGYVAGLINPFTLAAAAAGALAAGFYKGSQEAQEFNKALILTGGVAGVTAGQLADMAAALDDIGGTQSNASAALGALVQTGKVGAESLQRYAQAAIEFERAGGGAATEVAKQFKELGGDPLKALVKLNEGSNFLTASLYEQVRALEQQGRTTEAARVAQDAFADATQQRARALEQNLGTVEKAWRGIKDAIKEAGDSLLSFGRQDTLSQQIKEIESAIKVVESRARRVGGDGLIGQLFQGNSAKELGALKAQLDALKEQERLSLSAAARQAESIKREQAKVRWLDEGSKYLTKQEKLAAEINRIEAEGLAAGKDREEIEKRIAKAKAAAADKGATKETTRELEQQQKLMAQLAGLSSDFYEDWDRLAVIFKDRPLDELAKAQADLLAKQPLMLAAVREEEAARKAVVKAYEDQINADRRYIEGLNRSAGTVEEQAQRLRDEEQAAALAAAQNISLAQAIQQVTIARLAEAKAKATAGQDYETAAALEREIAARRELITLIGSSEARKASADAARDAATEWQRAANRIEDSITDALMRGFESGKGFAENLRDVVINIFKSEVLRPVISQFVGSLLGTGGSAAGRSSGGLSIGDATNLLTMFSSGSGATAIGQAGGWLQNVGGSSGFLTSIGSWLQGSSSTAALQSGGGALGMGGSVAGGGTSSLASTAASAWPLAILAGMYASGKLFDAGVSDRSLNGSNPLNWPAKLDTGLLKGLGINDKLANIITGAPVHAALMNWGAGTLHTGGSSSFSGSGGLRVGYGVDGVGADARFGGAYSTQVEAFTTGIVQSVVGLLDSAATAFGKQAGFAAAAGFADDSSKDGAWGAFEITRGGQVLTDWGMNPTSGRLSGNTPREFANGQEGADQFLAAIVADTKAALEAIGIPAWAESMIDSLGAGATFEQLAGAVAEIQLMQKALTELGSAMPQLAGLTDTATEALLKSFGGIQGLAQSAAAYYELFYTEAERSADLSSRVAGELGKLGLAMPATRDAYRDLVEAQDLSTESGRNAYAALLQLAPAFADLVPAIEEVGGAVDQTAAQAAEAAARMAEAGRRALQELAQDRGGLEVDLLRAQGDNTGANARQRQIDLAAITEGLSATDAAAATAAYDYNRALQEQIEALNNAAAAERAVAAERSSLERQLLQLQGDTAALRALELAALDPGNRAIQERIWALQDAATAEARSAQELQAQLQAEAAFASQRDGLQRQILQLTGDTASLRQLELAALEPGNRALQERIYALQDEQAEAQRLAAVAAQGDSLQAQVERLLGQTAELRARELAAIDPANRGLQLLIWELEDAADAAEKTARAESEANQRAQAVAGERLGIERQILQLTGDTVGLRALELAALDPSNRALMERVYGLQDEADAAQKAQQVASERSGLERQILQLTGDTAALRALELAALDPSNRALMERLYALQDVAKAESEAAQKTEQIASEKVSLEQRLLQLQGNATELRARELAALDPSNRALLEQIFALEDQQTAAAEAAAALERFTGVMTQLGDTRFDLENQLLGLQGNDEEVRRRTRERELARLTEGKTPEQAAAIQAAYDYNEALRDQITALQESQAAAQSAAQAAEQTRQAWAGLANGLFDEAARIREMATGQASAESLAQTQARFAVTTAQARAGDQSAAERLPALAQALLAMAEGQARTFADLQVMRAQTAASLEMTGEAINARFGLNASGPTVTSDPQVLAELRSLREENQAQARALVTLQQQWLTLLNRWETNGLPETREVDA